MKTKGQLLEEVGLAATGVGSFLQNGKGDLFRDCILTVDWEKEVLEQVICSSGERVEIKR